MKFSFEIESIIELRSINKICVYARLLTTDSNWNLSDNSKLGQVPIENYVDIPRAHDENGNIRLDVYAFLLKKNGDKDKLKIKQVIELIP